MEIRKKYHIRIRIIVNAKEEGLTVAIYWTILAMEIHFRTRLLHF